MTVAAGNPGDIEEKALRDRVELYPADPEARYRLARFLGLRMRQDEALLEYSRLLATFPSNADYLLGAAQSHLWSNRPHDALPLLRKARRAAPAYADIWHVEIQALLASGENLAAARKLRDEARLQFPERPWRYPPLDQPEGSPLAAAPHATEEPAARAALELGLSRDRLSRQLPDWQQRHFVLSWRNPDGQSLFGGTRETDRYKQRDREVHAGGAWPFSPSFLLQFEAGASDTHHVLPVRYAAFQAFARPASQWTLNGGLRQSRYDSASTRILSLGADHYVGSERFSYTLFEGGPLGSRPVASHRVQWAHDYANDSWVGATFIQGRESEYSPGAGLLTSKVRSAAVSGQHGLTRNWSVKWGIEKVWQGDLYQRNGAQLALRHTF